MDGCDGTVIGKDSERDFAVFIPDKGCPGRRGGAGAADIGMSLAPCVAFVDIPIAPSLDRPIDARTTELRLREDGYETVPAVPSQIRRDRGRTLH